MLVKNSITTFLKAKGSRFPKLFLVLKLIEYMLSYEPSKTRMKIQLRTNYKKISYFKLEKYTVKLKVKFKMNEIA
jgi:hypothetical protein